MRISHLALGVLLLATGCSAQVESQQLELADLVKVMALGKMIDLNAIDSEFEQDFLIRVYEVPVLDGGDCFVETHGVCVNDYYIAVSDFDELPEYNVFKLGRFGEIVDFEWTSEDVTGHAEITMTVNQFPALALSNNPSLSVEQRLMTVRISPSELEVTE